MAPQFGEALAPILDKAITLQQPAIDRYVEKLRKWRPGSPSDALRLAEKQYLATVTGIGVAGGASSAVPGVGTGIGLVVSTVEIATFIEASAMFALACAEIHGVRIDDLERRRALIYAVLLGSSGERAIQKVANRSGNHWAGLLVASIDPQKLSAVNKVLGRNFVTKYGTKQGILVLGRAAPFGIGAAIGGGGNAALGYVTVRSARRAFGPAPAEWPLPPGDTQTL